MSLVKVLKKFKEGLITHQIFSKESIIKEPIYIDANYKYMDTSLDLYNGIIYFYIEQYDKLVFEIIDDFIPKDIYDIGGISVLDGQRIYNLYHYENEVENIEYKYIRVTKIMNNYYGEGSSDGINWMEKGSRFLINAELIGVTYESIHNSFPLKEIKIYKDPSWYIYGLYEGFIVKVYNDKNQLIHNIIVDKTNIVKITDSIYPRNCRVEIIDNQNNVMSNSSIADVWGGDEYYMSVEIELYNSKRVLLNLEEAKYLGITKITKPLRELIYIVNKTNSDTPVTLRISQDSPAYNWVNLEYLTTLGKEIFIPLKKMSEDTFHIVIEQPGGGSNIPPDYKPNEKYTFYLELV